MPSPDATGTPAALFAALDAVSSGDGRYEDPHYIARLMHGVSALLANAAADPGEVRELAVRVACSRQFAKCACLLLEDGGHLSFAAPQALALVLAGAGATHAPLLEYDGGRLVAGAVGAIAASKPDPVLQPLVATMLKALCDGPCRKQAADLLSAQVPLKRVVCGFFETATCRSAGTSAVSALLTTEAGREWCTRHFEAIELFVVGSALHAKLVQRTGKGSTTPS